ncbi:hypothetical protein GE09DRAFT_1218970 [Coniochaeta sp. 2T2.1]|nr:hypothetical protein GE09DRAFT_1218970 [Coniochaeta sp. 2T2.1]
MAGNWPYDPGQDRLTRSNHWPAPQYSQPTAYNAYGQNEYLPVPNLPIHESFYAVRARADPTYSLPAVQHHDDDGLDAFDRRLLSTTELPAAHPQSSRRLTLPQAEPIMRPAIQQPHHGDDFSGSQFDPSHASYHEPAPQYSHPQQPAYLPDLSQAGSGVGSRDLVHQYHQELHHAIHQQQLQLSPPSHSVAPSPYVQVEDPVTPPYVRSSSDAGTLSPSAKVSLRKQQRSHNPSQRKNPSMSIRQQEAARPSLDRHRAPPIPPIPPQPPMANGIQLVSPQQALPHNVRSVFPYPVFNAVQSKCFDSAYGSNDNLVVSAPTGSGKTAILELAICRTIAGNTHGNTKIVYQAPTKALCSERARDWEKKFSPLQYVVAELTGDTSQAELPRVREASIIVTTPEKWDSITRKWQDHQKLLELVGLFLIDEVHILKEIRGATLEAVVSRMKTIGNNVRFVALSATVPNSQDIAAWLGLNHEQQQLPAQHEVFGQDFRPVKLERHVFGYDKRMNDHVFDKQLDAKLPGLLVKHSIGKPILIFCFTRNSCEQTAATLAKMPESERPWKSSANHIGVLKPGLQEVVQAGVAYHHAGLDIGDRRAIEQAFLNGDVSVICCTSTLAVGVNLPCHTVVLKGTVTYQNDSIQELSDLEVMQMLGRAGRPQFDNSAKALILTSSDQKERYERMVDGKEILESTLHLNLIGHLNSEVGLRTITDIESAKKWLGSTFLSVRMRQNPHYYRLSEDIAAVHDTDSMLEEICERDVRLLQEYDIVTRDSVIRQTEKGAGMAKHMVDFETMKLLLELPTALTMEQLLTALSKAKEFRDFKFKPADAPILREVNQSSFILYRISEHLTKTWQKISLLVQAQLGAVEYHDTHHLRIEKRGIFERLQRLVRCLVICKGVDHDSVSVKTALELARSLAAGSWEGRPTELVQIPNIGAVSMRKLVSQNIRAVKDLVNMDCGQLERLLSRQPPFGKTLSDTLNSFPILHLELSIPSRKDISATEDAVTVPVLATLRYLNPTGLLKWNSKIPSASFIAETTAGLLCYSWMGSLGQIKTDTGLELRFGAHITALDQQIVCHFSCAEIVGTIVTKTLVHGLPNAAFRQKVRQVDGPSETHPGLQKAQHLQHIIPAVALDDTLKGRSDEYLDDMDDADAVDAVTSLYGHANGQPDPNGSTEKAQSQESGDTNYGDVPMLDNILDVFTPKQLPAQQAQQERSVSPGTDSARQSTQPHSSVTPGSSTAPSTPGDTADNEPVRLDNGRWRCNHVCSGGAPTKSGKVCTHRCCIEGLEKPRKIKPKGTEPKKRKAERPADQGVKETSAAPSPSFLNSTPCSTNKKRRISQQPAPVLGNTTLATFQPFANGSKVTGSALVEADIGDLDPADFEDDEFPDFLALAAQKGKGKAAGKPTIKAAEKPTPKAAEKPKSKLTEKPKSKAPRNIKSKAAHKDKDEAMDEHPSQARGAGSEDPNGGITAEVNGNLPIIPGSSQPWGAEDYLPTAPPAATIDFGSLSDPFDEDTGQSAPPAAPTDFGKLDDPFEEHTGHDTTAASGKSHNMPCSPAAQLRSSFEVSDVLNAQAASSFSGFDASDILNSDGDFHTNMEDTSLIGGLASGPPPEGTAQAENGAESGMQVNKPYADLSPDSYKKKLDEAARWCDIGSDDEYTLPKQFTSEFHAQQHDNAVVPPFDNDFGNFDDGMAYLTEDPGHATSPDDPLGLGSPAVPACMLGNGVSGGGVVGSGLPAGIPEAEEDQEKQADPEWVREFADQDMIDEYRDYVQFVD